jgi:hypothetical protein
MRRALGVLAGLWLLAGPLAAGAATFGTPVTFENGPVIMSCRLANLGGKPVTIQQVAILANDPGAGELGLDTCSANPLVPEGTCVFSGTTPSGHIGARVEVKGSGKTLRGICVVTGTDGSPQYLELR